MASDIIKDSEYWTRLCIKNECHGRIAILDVLHNEKGNATYKGLSRDPNQLYNELSNFHQVLTRLKNKKVINDDQWAILFPANKQTNSEDFDIPLIVVLIRNCTTFPPPTGGWFQRNPPMTDQSIAANCLRLVNIRNFVYHYGNIRNMKVGEFNLKWTEGDLILIGLGYDITVIADLKTKTLDPHGVDNLKCIVTYVELQLKTVQQVVSRNSTDITSMRQLAADVGIIKQDIIACRQSLSPSQEGSVQRVVMNQIHPALLQCQPIYDKYQTSMKEIQNKFCELVLDQEELKDSLHQKLSKREFEVEKNLQKNKHDKVKETLGQYHINLEQVEKTLEQNHTKLGKVIETYEQYQEKVDETLDQKVDRSEFNERVKDLKSADGFGELLLEVFDITADMIEDNWNKLAVGLGLPRTDVASIEEHKLTNKGKMIHCFDKLERKILWSKLKRELKKLRQKNIIERILEETCLTYDISIGIDEYRNGIKQKLSYKQVQQAFMEYDGASYTTMDREQAYVNLSILDKTIIDKEWNNSDGDYHLKQMSETKRSLPLEEILTDKDRFTIMNGIAGIGKSTLIETIIYRWSKGEMFNGSKNTPLIKVILPIKCRDLNTLIIDENTTTEEILLKICPQLFENISFENLQEISKHVLVLVDGADELKHAERLGQLVHNVELEPSIRILLDLINLDSNFLPGKKVLIAGRPEACREIQMLFGENFATKKIEVCGFDEKNMVTYVVRSFHADIESAKDLWRKIKQSHTVFAMSHIPVYLWIICDMYRGNTNFDFPKTATELLLYACLVFLRNHFKTCGDSMKNLSLEELCENKDVLEHIGNIAEFSYITLNEKKVIFRLGDMNGIDDLEKTGFIVKSRQGESGFVYQFRHLVLQELFCALYIFLCVDETEKRSLFANKKIRGCISLVAGLEGIYFSDKEDEPTVLKKFLMAIMNVKELVLNDDELIIKYLDKQFINILNIQNMERIGGDAQKNTIYSNRSHFETYRCSSFEYQIGFSDVMKAYIEMSVDELNVSFSSLLGNLEKEWNLHFLEQFCIIFPKKQVSLYIEDESVTFSTNSTLRFSTPQLQQLSKCASQLSSVIILGCHSDWNILFDALVNHVHLHGTQSVIERIQYLYVELNDTGKNALAKVAPFVKWLECGVSTIVIPLSAALREHVINTGTNCYLEHLGLFNWHDSVTNCEIMLQSLCDCLKYIKELTIINGSTFLSKNAYRITDEIKKLSDDGSSTFQSLELKYFEVDADYILFQKMLPGLKFVKHVQVDREMFTPPLYDLLKESIEKWVLSGEEYHLETMVFEEGYFSPFDDFTVVEETVKSIKMIHNVKLAIYTKKDAPQSMYNFDTGCEFM